MPIVAVGPVPISHPACCGDRSGLFKRRGRPPEWPLLVEPARSAAAGAGCVGGLVVSGRDDAPGAGAECRLGAHREEACAAVPQAAVVNLDETGWREAQRRAWLWTVVTAALTVFRIDRRRGGAVVEALLGADYAGVVGSDRWSAYRRFPAEQRALCWAHRVSRSLRAAGDRREVRAAVA